jgi:hypothetical protein
MKRITLVILLLLVSTCLQAEGEVFRWVDEAGNVHYSDQPGNGAEKVELGSPITYTSKPYKKLEFSDPKSKGVQQAPYVVKIIQPVNDDNFLSNSGDVEVVLQIEPELRVKQGHKIALWLDDAETQHEITETRYRIANVPRGTHTLYVQLRNHIGEEISKRSSVTFYLRQSSRLFPKPAP